MTTETRRIVNKYYKKYKDYLSSNDKETVEHFYNWLRKGNEGIKVYVIKGVATSKDKRVFIMDKDVN